VKPRYFKSSADFRAWLARNHDSAPELLVGFHKKDSGKGGLTYPEALDEALCFGWIDGVRRRVDADNYSIRFSPRRPRSIWSAVNTRRAGELIAAGRMDPSGLKVFRDRDETRSNAYSYERENVTLDAALLRRLRANRAAAAFFDAQSPSYRRIMAWFVMSARRDETRARRLDHLIAACAAGRRLGLEPVNASKPDAGTKRKDK
jgi:uncharacterized protein YdeI (YjbR/CyaY-like superfamily)